MNLWRRLITISFATLFAATAFAGGGGGGGGGGSNGFAYPNNDATNFPNYTTYTDNTPFLLTTLLIWGNFNGSVNDFGGSTIKFFTDQGTSGLVQNNFTTFSNSTVSVISGPTGQSFFQDIVQGTVTTHGAPLTVGDSSSADITIGLKGSDWGYWQILQNGTIISQFSFTRAGNTDQTGQFGIGSGSTIVNPVGNIWNVFHSTFLGTPGITDQGGGSNKFDNQGTMNIYNPVGVALQNEGTVNLYSGGSITAGATTSGTFVMSGGSINSVNNSGGFTQSGGTVTSITNSNTYTWNGGIINGSINNSGTFNDSVGITTGLTNSGTVNIYNTSFAPSSITNSGSSTFNLETGGNIGANQNFGGGGGSLNIGKATKPKITTTHTITNLSNLYVGYNGSSSGSQLTMQAHVGLINQLIVGSGSTLNVQATLDGSTAGNSINYGSIVISTGGNFNLTFSGVNTFSNQGTIYVDGGGQMNTVISNTSGAGSLIFGQNTQVTTAANLTTAVTNVATVTVQNSASNFTFGAAVTGISSAFTNNSNLTLTANLDGTGSFANNGALTVTSGGSITSFPTISMGNGSSLTYTSSAAFNPTLASAVTTSNPPSGSLPGSNYGTLSILNTTAATTTTLTTSGAISYLDTINVATSGAGNATFSVGTALNNISTINIGTGTTTGLLTSSNAISNVTTLNIGSAGDGTGALGTLHLTTSGSNAGTLASVNNLVINGQFTLDAGTKFSMGTGQQISGTNTHATINNSGQFTIGGNVNFSGGFQNLAGGITTVTDTPTINFNGTTFTNNGNIYLQFSQSNSLPQINVTNNAATVNMPGVITVTYNNNYIATGKYTFFSTPATINNLGALFAPSPTRYISAWSITQGISGGNNVLQIQVTRDGYDKHAQTPQAAAIGALLEQIGASGTATQVELDLLNSFEKIGDDATLTSALMSLLPPVYNGLITKRVIDSMHGAVDIRITEVIEGIAAGDMLTGLSVWLRPFHTSGHQQAKQQLLPYSESTHGWIFGLDRMLSDTFLMGAAGTVAGTNVVDQTNTNSATKINTYQAIVYGSLQTARNTYVDGVLSGGVSNYHSGRTLSYPGYQAVATANYTSQQLTAKLRVSKMFRIWSYWQLTPDALAQYTYQRFLGYSESGIGALGTTDVPHNENLLRFGAGLCLGVPFYGRDILSVPSVYAKAYVDAKGGNQDVNTSFIAGGPTLVNTVQQSRLLLKFGASYELKLNDHLEFVANWDYLLRREFKGQEIFLNVRYTF